MWAYLAAMVVIEVVYRISCCEGGGGGERGGGGGNGSVVVKGHTMPSESDGL